MKRDKEYVLTIITTYNRARLLTESIESVLAQDYPYKKIIIVDDGSIDETANVCQNYVKKYPEQIIYHYKKNGGCASARNRGLSLVGEDVRYVCFLDDDDRFLPGKFRREVDLLKENPHANFSYADSVIHDEAGNSEKLVKAAAAGKPNRFAIEHFLTNEVKSGALLYNVEVVRGRRFREDLKYNEDSEFLQRVAIECTAVYSPEPSCWVRWHQGCKSRNLVEINKALLWSALNIIQTYPTFYQTYKGLID
ncbi:MAG: glycosyltransferase family 2 protein, partial [Thermodesulfobacteriota bacterium]